MLYHLSEWLLQNSSSTFLNLTRYITFRTIASMLTAFFISLLIGRWVINFLYRKKIRDIVRDYSVMSVESKGGTPTMGGVLMFIAILGSIALWGNFRSSYLYFLLFAMVWFGAIGGLDDYLKIRHRDSDKGLSRSMKYLSQIGYAIVFGVLFLHSSTTPLPHPDKESFCALQQSSCRKSCKTTKDCQKKGCLNTTCKDGHCQSCLKAGKPLACKNAKVCQASCGEKATCVQPWKVAFSRRKGEKTTTFRPSQLYIPFYKYPLVDLSWLYLLVIIFMIVYASNAVNFADGLDGLATVPTLFSFLVYGIYAYVLGNAVVSKYLLFPSLPGAGEVAVFCGAVVGAGLGFLWFNSYPAEVFMGDTGAITLGGILGTIIILLKQEVLFFLVGGIFFVELLSVMIQDWLGIQVLGKRILFRAPIHHTFQHRGISEPKIVVRFWIISSILAIIGLAALKIR